MKKAFLMTILGLSLSTVAMADERVEKIINDPVLVATLEATMAKYDVNCKKPTTRAIQWRCLKGPKCGYTFSVSCRKPDQPNKGVSVKVTGFDVNGGKNDLRTIELEEII